MSVFKKKKFWLLTVFMMLLALAISLGTVYFSYFVKNYNQQAEVTQAAGIDSYTKLLLHFDNNLIDSSASAHTVNGSNSFSGGGAPWNEAFRLTRTDSVRVDDHDDWYFGAGRFTIDFWFYINYLRGDVKLYRDYTNSSLDNEIILRGFGDNIEVLLDGMGSLRSRRLDDGRWYHLALVRGFNDDDNLITLFIDGIRDDTRFVGSWEWQDYSQGLIMEGDAFQDNVLINEMRVTKGVARWIEDFTPPTQPYNNTDVVTGAASNITDTGATLNASFGESSTIRGFNWGQTTGYELDSWTETGSFGTGAYSYSLSGLSSNETYHFRAKAFNGFGWSFGNDAQFTTFQAPIRSNGQPAGALPWGTTQTTLSLDTDVNADCRYSDIADLDYDSMINTFSTTGGTSHDTSVSGLVDGTLYTYYVKCKSTTENTEDYPISFFIKGIYNISGYAWNDVISWVSFNCADIGICDSVDYGVNLEADNNLIGYAWNEIVGWIWFDPAIDAAMPGSDDWSAKKEVSGDVTGWARICSMADDWPNTCTGGTDKGWIRMSDTWADGVTVEADNQFHGYAWSEDFGWFSFNCVEDGDCGTNNYYVIQGSSVLGASNVRGFAWSENYGWISFNHLDCDSDGNGYIDTDAMALGCGGDNTSVDAHNYGVSFDLEGTDFLSGTAWSPNAGWIYFEDYGTTLISNSPAPQQWAQYSGPGNNEFSGWANVLALGNDGWISFNDEGSTPAYTVKFGEVAPREFSGWAWNGTDTNAGMGWISFNSKNCDLDGDGVFEPGVGNDDEGAPAECPNSGDTIAPYKVYLYAQNQAPTVSELAAPGYTATQYCDDVSVLNVALSWNYNDYDNSPIGADPQSAYQIQFDNDSDFSSLIFDTNYCDYTVAGTGDCFSDEDATSFLAHLAVASNGEVLSIGGTYYWRVKVWDSIGAESSWLDHSFVLPAEEYPDAYFDWNPKTIGAEQNVLFDTRNWTIYYSGGSADMECNTGCNWQWTVNPLGASILSSTASVTPITFYDEGQAYDVSLDVTDAAGNTCSTSTTINASSSRLPTWIEVK